MLLIVGALAAAVADRRLFMTPESDWPSVLFYPIGIYVLLAIGLNIVVGQAGLLDLGYVAFFAIGAYTMAVFGTKLRLELLGDPGRRHRRRPRAVRAHPGRADAAVARRLPGHRHARASVRSSGSSPNNIDYIGGPRGIAASRTRRNRSSCEIFGVRPLRYGVLDSAALLLPAGRR